MMTGLHDEAFFEGPLRLDVARTYQNLPESSGRDRRASSFSNSPLMFFFPRLFS